MLTTRELEVLERIIEGYRTEEIALQLFVSVSTVESHRRNILMKLSAKNIAHAVSLAYRKKIID